MKNFLLLILSFIALPAWSQSVQYRPTAYTAPFVSTINSAAAAQTYLGIPSSTNNAFLSSNNVFTATNRYTGTVIITNAASTISGNGAGLTNIGIAANGIGLRLLWSSPTNIYINSVTAASNKTNNGDFSSISYIAQANIPALLGSNSSIVAIAVNPRTNANTTAATVYLFAGPATNFVGTSTTVGLTTAGVSYYNTANGWLFSAGSWTNQFQGNVFTTPLIGANSGYYTNFCDTSSSFTLYIGCATATTHTNFILTGFRLYEVYAQ